MACLHAGAWQRVILPEDVHCHLGKLPRLLQVDASICKSIGGHFCADDVSETHRPDIYILLWSRIEVLIRVCHHPCAEVRLFSLLVSSQTKHRAGCKRPGGIARLPFWRNMALTFLFIEFRKRELVLFFGESSQARGKRFRHHSGGNFAIERAYCGCQISALLDPLTF